MRAFREPLALLLMLGCAAETSQSPDLAGDLAQAGSDAAEAPDLDGNDLAAPPDLATVDARPGPGTPKGLVKLTYYWVAMQSDYPGADDTPLCDVSTNVIAMVPSAFAAALRLEGTGKLNDGRMLNYGGSCACAGQTVCFIILDQTKYPWGLGVQSRALKPFRSVAVDRLFVPFGTKIYVPEFDGLQMPSSYGFVHDGCVQADDTGGSIDGAHFDFFAAEKANYRALDPLLPSMVTAYVDPPRCP